MSRLSSRVAKRAFLLSLSVFTPLDRVAAQSSNAVPLPPVEVTGSATEPGSYGGLSLDVPSTAGSRLGLTPLETPASVQTLQGEEIRSRGQSTVNQAVSRATGFSTIATPGNGENGLSLRGFTGVGSFTQELDGIQMFVGSGTTTFPFDTWNVDRVEILSGPAAVLYGTGTIGGTVNVVTRQPDPTGYHTEARLTAGSFGTFGEQVDTTGPINKFVSYRFDISNFNSSGYVDRGQSRSFAFSGALRFDFTPELRVTVSNDYGQRSPMNYLGTPLVNGAILPSLRNRNFNVTDAEVQYNDDWTRVRTEWTPSGAVKVENDAYFLKDHRVFRQVDFYNYLGTTAAFPAGALQVSGHREVLHRQSQYGDHLEGTATSTIAGLENKTVGGIEYAHNDFELRFNSPFSGTEVVNLFNFVPGTFTNPVGTTPSYRNRTDSYAAFAEDRIALTKQVTFVAGLRSDTYDILRQDMHLANTNTRNSLNSLGWNVGSVYEPIPKLSLYARYAEGSDPVNNVVSLTQAQQSFALSPGREVEIGAKQMFWNDRASWTLAAYRIVKNNLLVPDALNPAVTQQVGQQSSQGLELSVDADLGAGVRVQANGTILRARFDSFSENVSNVAVSRNGNTPPNVPEQAANVWLGWNFAPGWTASTDLQYVGKRFADNANLLTLPAYSIVGAGLSWQATPVWRVDFRVENAFNDIYVTAPYNGGAQWFLGAPFSAFGSISAKF